MGIINRLSRDVYDKIAAGEVVERPASVIKELVENSIDAGADKITVEIKNGGSIYMSVTDNGSGMTKEDAEASFLRHATSKISTAEDLDKIMTMGFRGEALSSIGAVSEVDLFTKKRDEATGTHVICAGGEIRSVSEVGTPDGTIFIVKNLFYNVPARLKFLKKDATEAAYIANIMTRFILSHPEISFKLINNGKEQLFSPGDNSIVNAIYSVYGKNYAKSAIEFSEDFGSVKVYGAIGKSDTVRPNKDYQSFFINKRYVKSPLVWRAIEEAYKNQVMIGKFPMAVINVSINPSDIDINVHPTKMEVKFSDEATVYRSIYHSIKNALYSTLNIPEIKAPEEIPPKTSEIFEKKTEPTLEKREEFTSQKREENLFLNEERVTFQRAKKPQEREYFYNTERSNDFFLKKQQEITEKRATPTFNQEIERMLGGQSEPFKKPEKAEERQEHLLYTEEEKKVREIRVVGQVFDTYIIVESEGEMLIIDQHAAHERLMYEKLKEDIREKKVASQGILVPVVVSLNPIEYAAYKEYSQYILEMGFETEDFGDNSIVIRSTPYDLDSGELEQLMIDIINQFSENKAEIITEKQDRLLYTIACKAAVKANHTLSALEQKELAEKVLDFNNINTCPHGRPITISMSKKEMEKLFKRIV